MRGGIEHRTSYFLVSAFSCLDHSLPFTKEFLVYFLVASDLLSAINIQKTGMVANRFCSLYQKIGFCSYSKAF